jgi:hypothetical protein
MATRSRAPRSQFFDPARFAPSEYGLALITLESLFILAMWPPIKTLASPFLRWRWCAWAGRLPCMSVVARSRRCALRVARRAAGLFVVMWRGVRFVDMARTSLSCVHIASALLGSLGVIAMQHFSKAAWSHEVSLERAVSRCFNSASSDCEAARELRRANRGRKRCVVGRAGGANEIERGRGVREIEEREGRAACAGSETREGASGIERGRRAAWDPRIARRDGVVGRQRYRSSGRAI